MIEPHHLLNGLLFYYRKAHQFARSVFLERYFSPALHVAIVEFLYVKICRLHIFEQDFFFFLLHDFIYAQLSVKISPVCAGLPSSPSEKWKMDNGKLKMSSSSNVFIIHLFLLSL